MRNGVISGFRGLVMNKSVAFRVAEFVCRDFAGKDIAKGAEGIMERLVVNSRVQVLDEDVAGAGFTEGRISLRPHDTTGTVLDQSVVEFLKSLLTYILVQ